MFYMLDTDICSYILKNNSESVVKKFKSLDKDVLCISIMTYSELLFEIQKKNLGANFVKTFKDFTSRLEIISFDVLAAKKYAELRNLLEKQGNPIANMDILIASSAMSIKAVLVTNNLKHFKNIPNLKVENWI